MTRLALLLVCLLPLTVAPARAQRNKGYRPPAPPAVKWIAGRIKLIELKDGHPDVAPPFPVQPVADGSFLFGPTPGYDVKVDEKGALVLTLHGQARSRPVVVTKTKAVKLPASYGGGKPTRLVVDFVKQGAMWMYRLPLLMQVTTPKGTFFLKDIDQDGWYDDLDTDQVAVGKQPDGLQWQPFTGEISLGEQRYLVGVNGTARAALWPISADVPKGYVRHISEINAVRRFLDYPPVGLAEELSRACELHSKYCAKHGLTHPEDKSSPLYTPEGHHAGMNSNLGYGKDGGAAAIGLLQTLWHRNHYLKVGLRRVGVGTAPPLPGARYPLPVWTSNIFTHGGRYASQTFTWPADRALDVWVRGQNENPNPYPKQPVDGPFVTLFQRGAAELRKSTVIRPRGGEPLPHDWTDPANPARGAPKRYQRNANMIVIIPHQKLEPGKIYDVEIITDKGTTYRWSFRTQE